MFENLNAFATTEPQKQKRSYSRILDEEVYELFLKAKEDPSRLNRYLDGFSRTRQYHKEVIQLYLSGVKPYYIGMQFGLNPTYVNHISRHAYKDLVEIYKD